MRHDVELVRLRSWRSSAVGYSVFVFLVRDQLIDTGFPGARDTMARVIEERRPRGVIVTHQHEDHAGNVELVARRGIPVAMAPVTESVLYPIGSWPVTVAASRELYGNEINEGLFMRPGQVLTKALVVIEDKVIDGAVNGLGTGVRDSSTGLGRAQTGFARTYALTMLFGVVIVAATLVVRF
jgi:hypothetical protein